MKRWVALVLVVGAMGGAVLLRTESASAQGTDKARGQKLYAKHCQVCHGEKGDGSGEAAYLLHPKPRDFTRGAFRLISTGNGTPTDEDLLRTITQGMPGSAMPPWDRLDEADRRLLVGTVKELWRNGLLARYRKDDVEPDEALEYVKEDTTPGDPVSFAGETKPAAAEAARGRIVYFRACAPCHGLDGRGKSTQKLMDSRGFDAPARDFTKGIFKGGSEARDIYARLRTGMKGTAMPTYAAAALSEQDAWAVTHYIRMLIPRGAQDLQQQKTLRLNLRRVEKVPVKEEEWWAAAPLVSVPLMPLWWRDERPEQVAFQAVHDGKTLALRLAWEDRTENLRSLRNDDFHDGAAVQLSWDEDPPFFGMGDASSSVLIWSWKASWQEDRGTFVDLEAFYPHMHVDYYPSQKNTKPGQRPSRAAMAAPHHDPRFLTGWGAGNPVSDPDRASAVETARAKGLGTLTTEKRDAQTVQGMAAFDRGVWSLVIRAEVPLERCRGLFVAFAVWDGSQRDRNGQKSVSIWHRLELE
jgi:cytochrome c oxidase cbb3-type subunit 2